MTTIDAKKRWSAEDMMSCNESASVAATSTPDPRTTIDEECVDREMQVGESTGVWIPGVNDCHTVVKGVIDKCHQETVAKALEAEAATRPGNAAVGAR